MSVITEHICTLDKNKNIDTACNLLVYEMPSLIHEF
jgi:hypothetical protein